MEKLDAEKYISSNEYKKFCEANKCELDDNLVNKHNENFIKRKLVEYMRQRKGPLQKRNRS